MIRSSPLGRAEFEVPRRRLAERLRALGIQDARVLEAVANVPRHLLIPEPLRHLLTGKSYVYADRGETMLKGFEDAVRLFEVRWGEATADN